MGTQSGMHGIVMAVHRSKLDSQLTMKCADLIRSKVGYLPRDVQSLGINGFHSHISWRTSRCCKKNHSINIVNVLQSYEPTNPFKSAFIGSLPLTDGTYLAIYEHFSRSRDLSLATSGKTTTRKTLQQIASWSG